MIKLHHLIKSEILKSADNIDQKTRLWVARYLGTNKPTFCLKSLVIKKISADMVKNHITSSEDFYTLLDSLYEKGTSFEELAIAANIFDKCQKYRPDFDLNYLEKWLNFTTGWAEVDSLCQSNFGAKELLKNWNSWQNFLTKLSKDKNIQVRRASLVLLCKSLRQSNDVRLLNQSLKTTLNLIFEKEILITKAISWILRSATKNFPNEIGIFVEENKNILPKIAYRETLKKLTTGKKN